MNPSYDFTGQAAFVTGASSGMGLATARAFAAAGAAVTLADVNDDALTAAENELREAGHRVLAVHCDVADEAAGLRSDRQLLISDLDWAEAEANQPINRLGTAEEMAAAVLWLCSPGASFVVGVALPVDGGYTAR